MKSRFNGDSRVRSVRKRLGTAALVTASVLTMAACAPSDDEPTGGSSGGDDVIKIGYVTPRTGALNGFTDGDDYMLAKIREYFEPGIEINGTTYQVEILDRDSGSDAAKAGELAQELITDEHVDLMMAAGTPETVNPVVAQCEANAVPCMTTNAPWQAVIFGAGYGPDNLMQWTHHFFFGIEGFGDTDPHAWDQIETNKKVGVLWPNDSDGAAFRDPVNGYGPFVEKYGYTLVDPGAYENLTQDFTSIIQTFKDENVEIIAGIPLPPDFVTFWTQAQQQGFHPKIATVGKALFFPQTVPSIPDNLGDGLAFATWWGPTFPYESSLDGTTPAEWIADFESDPSTAGLTWNQATPHNYALFELAVAAFQAAGDPHDKQAVNDAFDSINMMTLAGQIDFPDGPFPDIAVVPTLVGQWELTDDGVWQWVVVDNTNLTTVPVDRPLEPLS